MSLTSPATDPASAEQLSPNCTPLGGPFFIVRTQAGFRKAYKLYAGQEANTKNLQGFPKQYPCLVHFSEQYNGNTWTRADCLHVNHIKDKL